MLHLWPDWPAGHRIRASVFENALSLPLVQADSCLLNPAFSPAAHTGALPRNVLETEAHAVALRHGRNERTHVADA